MDNYISYIIPAFNCAETIGETVKSIYAGNSSSGDEVIIVDDKSSDKTIEIINKLMHEYHNIQLVRHSYNQGGGAARNTAVESAKNGLIFCLDSDNILVEKSVLQLKDVLLKNDLDCVAFGAVHYFRKSTAELSHIWEYKKTYSLEDFILDYKLPAASGNYLFSKSSWENSGKYPVDNGALDTWGFGLRQTANGFIARTVSGTYYYHRTAEDSYWPRDSRNRNMSIEATKLLLPYLNKLKYQDKLYVLLNYDTWFNKIGHHNYSFFNKIKYSLLKNIK